MTTSELKSYIDRTLGNSLRCLLPSFWWKRLFGLMVDTIDEAENRVSSSFKKELNTKVNKEEVTNIKSDIDVLKEGNLTIFVPWDLNVVLTEEEKQINADVYRKLKSDSSVHYSLSVKARHAWYGYRLLIVNDIDIKFTINEVKFTTNIPDIQSKYPFVKTGYTLTSDGSITMEWLDGVDDEMSDSSYLPVANKTVKKYIDDEIAKVKALIK